MKTNLPEIYLKLKRGNKMKINGKIYTIIERKLVKTKEGTWLRYELGNNFVFEYDHDWGFFQYFKKRFFGFEVTWSKVIKIKEITIVK